MFGPRQVLAEELVDVEGIDRAYLFGSWAARYAGEAGRPPADLDVLVIGDPERDELDDGAQRAAGRLAREVNVTIRSPAWWREGTGGFHTDVTRRPLVPLFSAEAAAGTSRYKTRSSPSSDPASGHFAHSAGSVAHATASSTPARTPPALRKTT